MKTQRRRKKRGRRINKGNLAILMVIAVAALVLIGAGIGWLLSNREPAFLKPQVSSSEELKDKARMFSWRFIIRRAPTARSKEALAQNAEVIFNDLKAQTENYQKEKKPLLVKADYQMNVNQDRYVSLEYTISRNENETVQEQRQSYLYDLTDHQWLDASSLLDENALKWLSANLRAQLKADDNWKEAAYTLPLIEATAWDSGNFSDFTLKDGMLIFNFPAGKLGENAYRWEFPVSNLGEHFLLDIGQGTLPENNVRIAPRVIDPNKPMVALTFDDGPWPTTSELLDVLKENDAVATFFTIGEQISDKTDYVETIQRMAAEGHQIGTHSYDHAATGGGNGVDMTRQSPEKQIEEVQMGQQAIADATASEASKVFRSPGGNFHDEIIWNLQPYITSEIGWNVDTEDWRRPGADAIAERLLSVKPGDVVLMHDGGGDRSQTIEALKVALPQLRAEGYKFVTIDQLLAYDDAKALAQELASQQSAE